MRPEDLVRPAPPGRVGRRRALPGGDDGGFEPLGVAAIDPRQPTAGPMSLHRVLAGEQAVTPEMALRLGRLCGDAPGPWLRMQTNHDLRRLERELRDELARVVDFEIFRADLDRALNRSARPKGGRPPMDAVPMFKILVLQALRGLSDEQVEYRVRDRLSFMRFLGLGLAGRVPDYSTVWRFREALAAAGAIEPLFARFDAELKAKGYLALGGQIVDASIVEAPKQRMTKDEKAQVKRGETPAWPAAKARHKDVDARWTVKRGRVRKKPGPGPKPSERQGPGLLIPAFGDKNHIDVDRRHRLIRRWTVTHAAGHDGAHPPELLAKDAVASRVWADTAYRGAADERAIGRAGRRSMSHFRKPKGRAMPGPHRRANRARAKVRAAVEHVFAEQKARMGLFVRTVGLARARAKVGLANLASNMRRLVWLDARTAAA